MKCFQSLICPYRNPLLTVDSTASGLVESFMPGSYRPEADTARLLYPYLQCSGQISPTALGHFCRLHEEVF